MSVRIRDIATAALVANLVGTVLLEADDNASAFGYKATLANLRTAMFAGGTGYTANDPFVCGTMQTTGSWKTAAVGTAVYGDGIIGIQNSAGNDFVRLLFGGSTASYPSLKRNGTVINARLADDSADCNLLANRFTTTGGSFQFLSTGFVSSGSDGVITLLNNATTGFSRLTLGGTTASFPSLKRNGTAIDVRLADDSGYAPFNVGTFNVNGATVTSNTIYCGADFTANGNLRIDGFAIFSSAATGVVKLTDWAGTSFGRFQLGGTTSSFPAFKRSGATIAFRLADDSADAAISAAAGTFSGNLAIAMGAQIATNATNGFVFVSSCAGTPTGVPASIPTGSIPSVYDTTANKIWFYNGSWRGILVA